MFLNPSKGQVEIETRYYNIDTSINRRYNSIFSHATLLVLRTKIILCQIISYAINLLPFSTSKLYAQLVENEDTQNNL